MPCIGSRLKNFKIAIKLERHKLTRIDPAKVLSPFITQRIIIASNYWHETNLTIMIFRFSSPNFVFSLKRAILILVAAPGSGNEQMRLPLLTQRRGNAVAIFGRSSIFIILFIITIVIINNA